MSGAPRRSASGARQAGDEFQHLVAWSRLLRAVQSGRRIETFELEALDAGNVDDVVIRFEDGAGEYTQVKYAVDSSRPLDEDYFLASARNGTSLLQKFHATWKELKARPGPVVLQLVTNRVPDHSDPVLSGLDGRTSTLAYILSQAAAVARRRAWCEHLGVEDEELITFLGELRVRAGCQYSNERETVGALMLAAGLSHDDAAIAKAVNLMRTWVLDGVRSVDWSAIRQAIDDLDIRVAEPASVLVIQTIAHDPDLEVADEVLDWVDHFDGDSPKTRRRAVCARAYQQMAAELTDAAERLITSGATRVVVRGPMRLLSWFAAGEALSEVTGVVVTCGQRGQQWSSDQCDGRVEVASRIIGEPDTGAALAVAVGFAADLGPDVVAFIESSGLPVKAVLEVSHATGDRISGAAESVGTATAIKQAVRAALRERGCREVHLFLAAPAALALHLGHQWNRVAPTTVWEDLGLDGYEPAFEIQA
jgi:hypothetical protein